MIILLCAVFLFEARLRPLQNKDKLTIHGYLLLYMVFGLILNWYLKNVFRWEYGIPGVDLTAHFNGAKALAEGVPIDQLYRVNFRFEIGFGAIGYILYAAFLALVSFSPQIITVEFSLALFYFIQMLAAITAALNMADFFAKGNRRSRNRLLLFFLSCVSVMQMASVLMRDIWIVFLISLLFRECGKEQTNYRKCIVLIVFISLLRAYMLLITVPVFIAYGMNKKKLAVTVSLCITAAFFIGQGIFYVLASVLSVRWEFDFNFSLANMVRYIMFPNIASQTYNVQNPQTGFHAIFGGNTEWIYYMLAVWNIFVFPIAIYGGVKSVAKAGDDAAIWGLQMVNVSLLYAVFYDNVSEPRHKLMILYALAFFYLFGITNLKQKNIIFYCFTILVIVLLLFLLIG